MAEKRSLGDAERKTLEKLFRKKSYRNFKWIDPASVVVTLWSLAAANCGGADFTLRPRPGDGRLRHRRGLPGFSGTGSAALPLAAAGSAWDQSS